jgi:hypothetical protein
MDLCKYRHVFGEERKGFHSVRVFDVAILDVVGTLAIALAVSYWTGASLLLTTVAAFGLGFFAHWLFCVKTKLSWWAV